MKVAYISSSTIPSRTANSIHVMKMCAAFCELGHKVTLYAPQRSKVPPHKNNTRLSEHYGIKETFSIDWMPASSLLREYDYAFRVTSRVRTTSPDLIFSRNLAAANMTSLLGIPTIFEIHEPPHDYLSNLGYKLLVRGRGLKHLVVITHSLATYFRSFFQSGLVDDKLLVLPDGVDLKRFNDLPDAVTAQQELGLPSAPLTLGYAGHLYAGRGIKLMLSLAQHFQTYRFLLAGGNEEDIAKYSQQAIDLQLSNVSFLGFIPNMRLPKYLAACDILLMPYQHRVATHQGGDTAKWASPMKMFEYMATGRLIISSDLPVLREVLNDTNSMFCIPDDTASWCEAIRFAASHQEWRLQLGAQAREDVKQYSWRRRTELALANFDARR